MKGNDNEPGEPVKPGNQTTGSTTGALRLRVEAPHEGQALGAGIRVFVEVLSDSTTPNVFDHFKAAAQVQHPAMPEPGISPAARPR